MRSKRTLLIFGDIDAEEDGVAEADVALSEALSLRPEEVHGDGVPRVDRRLHVRALLL